MFDYQHNMGLLLIEKKQWTSTNNELQQAYDEAMEMLKREKTSNAITLNEADKREENLRKALIDEKQFVAEVSHFSIHVVLLWLALCLMFMLFLYFQLENDLKYWQREHSVVKSTSEAKLEEANALVIGMKEKALEVDRERAIAEEKFSVMNRKSSELERKLKEVETREKVHQREHLSLVTEYERSLFTCSFCSLFVDMQI